MEQKEMIVFYVEENLGSLRMIGDSAYCIAFDGQSSYLSQSLDLPKIFEDIDCYLNNTTLTFYENNHAMFLMDEVMKHASQNSQITNITDFKNGDPISFGAKNFGYALGKLTVNISNQPI